MTMGRTRTLLTALAVLASAAIFNSDSGAQTPTDSATPTPDNAVMITIFFRHDESRPLSELNAPAREARLLQGISSGGCRSRELVRDDGDRTGRHAAASRLATARGQPHHREPGLGRLSHRVLSDLRLQGGRARRAREGAVNGEAEG